MLEIKESIDKLREELYSIIEQKSYDLSDSKVIEVSDNLNNAIVTYCTLLNLSIV